MVNKALSLLSLTVLAVSACSTNPPATPLDEESARRIDQFTGQSYAKSGFFTIDDGIPVKVFRSAKNPSYGTLIVAHSCSGVSLHTETVARRISEEGFNSVIVDSWGYRNIENVCVTNAVEGDERLLEIYKTVAWIKKQQWHQGKVFLMGHSHGGKVALAASKHGPERGIDKVVAFYPYCFPQDRAEPKIPTQVHIGENDDWTPAYRCRGMFKGLLGDYKNGEYFEYAGAYHGFDLKVNKVVPGLGEGRVVAPKIIRFNYSATVQAYSRAVKFLRDE